MIPDHVESEMQNPNEFESLRVPTLNADNLAAYLSDGLILIGGSTHELPKAFDLDYYANSVVPAENIKPVVEQGILRLQTFLELLRSIPPTSNDFKRILLDALTLYKIKFPQDKSYGTEIFIYSSSVIILSLFNETSPSVQLVLEKDETDGWYASVVSHFISVRGALVEFRLSISEGMRLKYFPKKELKFAIFPKKRDSWNNVDILFEPGDGAQIGYTRKYFDEIGRDIEDECRIDPTFIRRLSVMNNEVPIETFEIDLVDSAVRCRAEVFYNDGLEESLKVYEANIPRDDVDVDYLEENVILEQTQLYGVAVIKRVNGDFPFSTEVIMPQVDMTTGIRTLRIALDINGGVSGVEINGATYSSDGIKLYKEPTGYTVCITADGQFCFKFILSEEFYIRDVHRIVPSFDAFIGEPSMAAMSLVPVQDGILMEADFKNMDTTSISLN